MQETIRDRQEYLFAVTDAFLNAREAWGDDVSQQGLVVGGSLWMAAENLVAAFATGTIPGSCRALCRTVEVFERHWKDHTARAEVHPTDDLLPGDNVWKSADEVALARQGSAPKPLKLLEPVSELVAAGVSDEQIAKIYDWRDRLGNWDMLKVREAKATPGLHDGPEYYAQKVAEQKSQDELEANRNDELSQQIAAKVNNTPPVGPESIELLIAQGLNLAQICEIKQLPPTAVLEYCESHGLQFDGAVTAANQMQQPIAETPPVAEDPLDGMGVDLGSSLTDEGDEADPAFVSEQEILSAADDNPDLTPAEIGDAIGVAEERVLTVLSRRSEIESV